MIRYDVQCQLCGWTREVDSTPEDIDGIDILCRACGGPMKLVWLPNHRVPFPSFTTNHLNAYNNGQPLEVTSLQQIRNLEKKYQDRELRWEPGSWNNYHYGEE